MRHRKTTKTLDRGTSHRKALIKNLCYSFFEHRSIITTETKAKVIKSKIEKLITLGKTDTLATRRQLITALGSNTLATKIIKDIAPAYKERKGGYVKLIKLGNRKGDGAPTVKLTFV
ncbi:MAG: 50S ribosomal protein L17 [Patescibacteria group bacterium]